MNKEDNVRLNHIIQERINLNHPNLCKILANSNKTDSSWCSENHISYILSEFYDSNLEE